MRSCNESIVALRANARLSFRILVTGNNSDRSLAMKRITGFALTSFLAIVASDSFALLIAKSCSAAEASTAIGLLPTSSGKGENPEAQRQSIKQGGHQRQQKNDSKTLAVPEQFNSIQRAVDAADDGDIVLIAPGVYHERVVLANKSVHLCSWYLTTKDPTYIRQTVLDGSIHPDPTPEDDIDDCLEEVILVEASAGPETTITGLTIRDGDDGISCYAKISILFNRFVNNTDAIDYEGGGGECRFNEFVANDDDAVDLDLACSVIVANNLIRDNDDDGIEIRLHEYAGPTLDIEIRENVITGNGEDGIQIIDYPDLSSRRLVIERNVIADNAMAGIGMMSDGITLEDYRAAPIPEPISIVNNTLSGNALGITGGGNVLLLNNILVGHRKTPLKNLIGNSRLSHNLLWNNGEEPVSCELGEGVLFRHDPKLSDDFRPLDPTTIVDRGTLSIDLQHEAAQRIFPAGHQGKAPDLGAYEKR